MGYVTESQQPLGRGMAITFSSTSYFMYVMMQLLMKDEAEEGEGGVNKLLCPGGVGACSINFHLYKEHENVYSQDGSED